MCWVYRSCTHLRQASASARDSDGDDLCSAGIPLNSDDNWFMQNPLGGDVHMFGDRTCECRADVTEHTRTWCNARERWHTGRMRVSIGKVVHRIRHEKIVVTVHRDSGFFGKHFY